MRLYNKGITMKKTLFTLLVTLAIITQANAFDKYDVFVGGEAGLSWAQFEGKDGKYQNDEISTYGVKGGVVNDRKSVV